MKKIIVGAAAALTAFASVLPAFAAGQNIVTDIAVTVDTHIAGTPATQPPKAEVKSEGVVISDAGWTKSDDMLTPFEGTFETGKTYGVTVDVQPGEGMQFSETDLKVTVNGKTAVCNVGDGKLTVFAEVKAANSAKAAATTDSPTPDSATADSGKNYDNTNNANGAIPTNESNATVVIFAVVVGIAAAGGVAYYIITKNKK
ncbi:MAG: hypothetical protein UIH27_03695 [Ruminococcus sp.]|nr:hypothetical protein [Ruminococcus sp.]